MNTRFQMGFQVNEAYHCVAPTPLSLAISQEHGSICVFV